MISGKRPVGHGTNKWPQLSSQLLIVSVSSSCAAVLQAWRQVCQVRHQVWLQDPCSYTRGERSAAACQLLSAAKHTCSECIALDTWTYKILHSITPFPAVSSQPITPFPIGHRLHVASTTREGSQLQLDAYKAFCAAW